MKNHRKQFRATGARALFSACARGEDQLSSSTHKQIRTIPMTKIAITLTLLCTGLWVQVTESHGASLDDEQQIPRGPATQSVNPVLQWNRAVLVIVRTPGAQPATIHPTRSFAIMHAAIYDAVNTIDGTHKPYLVQLTGVSRHASQDAAAAAAAHEVLA